jgi:hypothetical protein
MFGVVGNASFADKAIGTHQEILEKNSENHMNSEKSPWRNINVCVE